MKIDEIENDLSYFIYHIIIFLGGEGGSQEQNKFPRWRFVMGNVDIIRKSLGIPRTIFQRYHQVLLNPRNILYF